MVIFQKIITKAMMIQTAITQATIEKKECVVTRNRRLMSEYVYFSTTEQFYLKKMRTLSS